VSLPRALDDTERELVETSLEAIGERTEELRARFFERLFAENSHIAELFGGYSQSQQQQMTVQMLAALFNTLEYEPWVADDLANLGDRHRDWEVEIEMYTPVTALMVDCAAELVGPSFDARTRALWTERLNWVAHAMHQDI
jgi:hemoglobin-like flavoprotein